MQRICRCIVLDEDFGRGRVRRQIIDTESGEMLATVWLNKKSEEGIFPQDCNAVICQVMFSRETLPGKQTELIYIKDTEINQEYYRFWNKDEGQKKGKKRHTGNKPGYVKVFDGEFSELTKELKDNDLGFLMRLCPMINWDTGELVSKKGKELLTKKKLSKQLGISERNLYRKIDSLMRAGVLHKRNDGFFIDRKYIAKG